MYIHMYVHVHKIPPGITKPKTHNPHHPVMDSFFIEFDGKVF